MIPNKAHEWDDISIRMMKLCGKSVVLSQMTGKKSTIVPEHKIENKDVIKSYQPISLLPIFSKIYERLIFNSIFNYFIKNNCLLKVNLASCPVIHVFLNYYQKLTKFINRLSVIQHLIKEELFFDNSKAFDKVWYTGLIFKLHTYGIIRKFLNLMQDYLCSQQSFDIHQLKINYATNTKQA